MQPLPQRAVALVGDRKDVWRDLAQVVAAVPRHGGPVVKAGELLVGVHRRQDGADVRLKRAKKKRSIAKHTKRQKAV